MKTNDSIIITGANGYIGMNLYFFLKKKNIHPILLDKKKSKNKIINKLNLLNYNALFKFTKKINIDYIIHLAANSSLKSFNKNPKKKIEENLKMTENIIKISKLKNAKIIFASSAAVYGNINKKVKETEILNPISYYGKSKVLCEKSFEKIEKCKILRLFNIVGNLNNINFNKSFFDYIENKKKKINLNYNLKKKTYLSRDYIHIYDLCSIIVNLIFHFKKIKFKIINVGLGNSHDCNEVLSLFSKFYKINFTENKKIASKKEITYSCSNNKLLKTFYNFKFNNVYKIIQNLRTV
jgi:UDP-glucose 4-epimerase